MTPYQCVWPQAPTEDLLKMVADNHINGLQTQEIDFGKWNCPALTHFMGHCLRVLGRFPERGKLIGWVSSCKPQSKSIQGWSYPPHRHPEESFYTLIHYLTPGDAFAPLVVFEGDEHSKASLVTPDVGLTVVIGGSQLHGVLPNGGATHRIALVINSVPEPGADRRLS